MKAIFTFILLFFLISFSIVRADGLFENTSTNVEEVPVNREESIIYPNPATTYIYVQLDLLDVSMANPTIEIRNILGNVMSVSVEKYDENVYRVGVSDFPVGYYLLTISCNDCGDGNGNYKESLKFLKQ